MSDRAHIYLPIVGEQGNLLAYVDVFFYSDDGRTLQTLYGSADPAEKPLPNPCTFAPGIIDVWCDDPVRLRLDISGPNGFGQTRDAVDLYPPPRMVTRTSAPLKTINNAPEAGKILRHDGTAPVWLWNYVAIPAHQHSGTQVNSTRLDLGVGDPDNDANQTWVGSGSGVLNGPSHYATSATSLGADAEPSANYVVVLGQASNVHDGWIALGGLGSPQGAIAMGRRAFVGGTDYGVSLGTMSGREDPPGINPYVYPYPTISVFEPVTFPTDSDGTQRIWVDEDEVSLRWLYLDNLGDVRPRKSEIGSLVAVPSVVSNALWLRSNVLIPGALTDTAGPVALAGSTSALGFFGSVGTTKPVAPPAGATDALASLVAALTAYGLY